MWHNNSIENDYGIKEVIKIGFNKNTFLSLFDHIDHV